MKKKNEEPKPKDVAGKARVELVPPEFVEDVSRVLAHGAAKYSENDWRKGYPWMQIYAATIRHLYAWAKGEDTDKESGLPHLAHAATNIAFLLTWSKTKKELDNRPKV